MPVIAYRMDPVLYHSIQDLVSIKEYSSVEEFLERAVRNQLALEAETVLPAAHDGNGARGSAPVAASSVAPDPRTTATAFALSPKRMLLPSPLAPLQKSDGPIWGQINRLLPLKIVCRRIALLADGEDNWPKIATVFSGLAEQTAAIGTALRDADLAAGRKRDLLATGLPRLDSRDSHERFLTQVVARLVRGATVQPGAVATLGLATFVENEIGLTEVGGRFAELQNPVLDGDPRTADATLSAYERQFLVRDVVPTLRSEHEDFALVLEGVEQGATTPDGLHEYVSPRFASRSWTATMLRTHMSGLVSRMVDLQLLTRSWEGRNVTYSVGPLADELAPFEEVSDLVRGEPR
jgi:hypothetical protein